MFKVPMPNDDSESFEGVAVVKLPDELDEVRTLFMFMNGDIPLQPSFDVIDRALRILHKYDVDRLFNWGLVHLHEYPKADPRSPKYFLNKEWYKYTDPAFLVRLIQITQLLDRRDLDGHAALAYYMLSTID
ncbi:hypothetical protein FRB93_007427 [Tulasnella sp. JGI-2019a]|nr:hypothetical protein FRB93_007427 [Tulasnella sp. JGI-2019a]